MSATWGYLLADTPFAAIFPDRTVPLISVWPIVPREAGAPRCYLVNVAELSDEQVEQLAALLHTQWRPECESIDQAIEYLRTEGLPLRVTWFSTVATTRMGLLNLP